MQLTLRASICERARAQSVSEGIEIRATVVQRRVIAARLVFPVPLRRPVPLRIRCLETRTCRLGIGALNLPAIRCWSEADVEAGI